MNKKGTLSEAAWINPPAKLPISSKPTDEVAFIPMASVSETGCLQNVETRLLGSCLKGYTAFQKGDVLVAKITPCMENGKATVVENILSPIGFGSTEFHVIRPKPNFDSRYLFHAVWNPTFRLEAGKNMTGSAGQKRVPKSFLERFEIPLPPLEEQKRIADILDKADAIRRKRQEALRLTDEFLRSVFLEMFGDPKNNPKGLQLVPLIKICSPRQWPTISTTELTETGFPVFGANGLIGYYSKYNHEKSTVLITCRGATCGTINVSPPKCYVTGNAMALDNPDPKRVTIEWLAEVLKMRGMADTITGSAQPQITRQNLQHVILPLPPLDLQIEFAQRLAKLEKQKIVQRAQLAELEALFGSLQHRAFSGELFQ